MAVWVIWITKQCPTTDDSQIMQRNNVRHTHKGNNNVSTHLHNKTSITSKANNIYSIAVFMLGRIAIIWRCHSLFVCWTHCKTAKPIKIPFGGGVHTRCSRNHVLDVALWECHLANTTESSEHGTMRPFVKFLWPLVIFRIWQTYVTHASLNNPLIGLVTCTSVERVLNWQTKITTLPPE